MTDPVDFSLKMQESRRESEIMQSILDMLSTVDLSSAERIITYVRSRVEIDWYDNDEET